MFSKFLELMTSIVQILKQCHGELADLSLPKIFDLTPPMYMYMYIHVHVHVHVQIYTCIYMYSYIFTFIFLTILYKNYLIYTLLISCFLYKFIIAIFSRLFQLI